MDKKNNNEEYDRMINSNSILLSFEGWMRFIEGFTRGLQTTKTVDTPVVMDCIGEVLEFMHTLKNQIILILQHCEGILKENEELKLQLKQNEIPLLETKEEKSGETV